MYYHTFFYYDLIEIALYSCMFYSICLWLKADGTKNLLGYFLCYCSITIFSWLLALPTLPTFLLSYSPVALLLFIIFHEKTLQKNLVCLRSLTPNYATPNDWLDTVIGSLIATINTNKPCTMIIEKNDALDHMLNAEICVNTPLNKSILQVLLTSPFYNPFHVLWITSRGVIKGMNVTLQEQIINESLLLQKDIHACTLFSDALIIHADHETRLFSVTVRGKTQSLIPVQEIKNCIQKHLVRSATAHFSAQRIFNENSSVTKTHNPQ
jgi:hypothetical protein